jgi:drug/metabolite transporter (DMT)-like permease
MFGIVVGFIGLIAVVGIESFSGNSHPASIAMMILAAMGYSYAIIMVTTNLPLVDGIAINGLAMAITSIFWAPLAIAQWPAQVSLKPALSLIALGVLCTALAFLIFFKLLVEIGPARGSLVTYLNTSVAVVLGVIVLDEPITIGLIVGLPLVLIGSYLASKKSESALVAKA